MSLSFDRAAAYYDATRGYQPEVGATIGAALASVVGAKASTRFLEIGVGTGRIALPIAEQGFEVTGIDISQAMMARLRAKLEDMARAGLALRLHLVEADMHCLPFDDAQFDAVIATHVFHLVDDPMGAAREALRVLRWDGSLLVCGDMVSGLEPKSTNEKWREIVLRHMGPMPNSAEAADRLLSQLCAADPDLVVEESRPVSWSFTTTPAEELDSIRRRLWSNTWKLPDNVFDACFRELSDWYVRAFSATEFKALPRTAEFVIRRVYRATAKHNEAAFAT